MSTKREKTSFTVSTNLKTALEAKGLGNQMQTGQAFYDGAANDIHLTDDQYDDGSFRTINITAGVVSFDFIEPSDPTLVRMYTDRELSILIGQTSGVGGSSGVLNGSTWTWTIPFNGVDKSASDTSKPDAMAKAFIKVVNII